MREASRLAKAGCPFRTLRSQPTIRDFILTFRLRVVYFGALIKPKWRNRQTRTTQNRVPSGNEGSIPSFGTRSAKAHSHYTPMSNILLHGVRGGCLLSEYLNSIVDNNLQVYIKRLCIDAIGGGLVL